MIDSQKEREPKPSFLHTTFLVVFVLRNEKTGGCMCMDRLTDGAIEFKDFEQWCYDKGLAFARELMCSGLTKLDDTLLESRDKKKFRSKGIRSLTIKTLMGEVEVPRRLYRYETEEGKVSHVHLLDQSIGLDTVGKISINLVRRIAEVITESSYRSTAEAISFTTGQSISHTGLWNVVQEVGIKIDEIDKKRAEAVRTCVNGGTKVVRVLQEEFDGVWINMQGKDRPKSGRKLEMKLASSYEGVKFTGNDKGGNPTYDLIHPIYMAGFESVEEFFDKKEGNIGAIYNLDEIDIRLINGDGAGWIKGFGEKSGENSHIQLDPFHIKKEIRRSGISKEQQEKIEMLHQKKKIQLMLRYIRLLHRHEEDEKKQKRIGKMLDYFMNNAEYMIPIRERDLELPKPQGETIYGNMGTMEGTVCNVAALRMKNRKASFTKDGAMHLARMICLKRERKLDEMIYGLSSMMLPEVIASSIVTILSAAQSSKTTGSGYAYPVNGGRPFTQGYTTNGRKSVKGITSFRGYTELVHR
jgi:hypothetical protein